ncbi:MAG: hypothetical protein KKG21_04780, partial [Candidatus Omnitrophica bacterium]|nr:hypothetical protein [Candidatus Omnitrophota bacterium]
KKAISFYIAMVVFLGISGFHSFASEILYAFLGMIIFAQAITTTGLAQKILDNPLLKGVFKFLGLLPGMTPLFQSQILTYSEGAEETAKGFPKYIATGRGPMLEHFPIFSTLSEDKSIFGSFEKSHLNWSFKVMLLAIWGVILWWNWALALSLFFILMPISGYFMPVLTNRGATPFDVGVKNWSRLYWDDIKGWGSLVKKGAIGAIDKETGEFKIDEKAGGRKVNRFDVILHGIVIFGVVGLVGLFLSPFALLIRKIFYRGGGPSSDAAKISNRIKEDFRKVAGEEDKELKELSNAAIGAVKDTIEGYAEDEYVAIPKRQWLLNDGVSDIDVQYPDGPLAKFLTEIKDENLVVFGGAIRDTILQEGENIEEFDIAIKAGLGDIDEKNIAEKLWKIFFGKELPNNITLSILEPEVRSIKPESEDYKRFVRELSRQIQAGSDFKERLSQHLRGATVDTLNHKEGCTEKNLLIRGLYEYLLAEARREALFVRANEKAGDLLTSRKTFRFKDRNIPIQFIGVIDESDGRFYATPENAGAFEEVPELSINRLAISKKDNGYLLYDQYKGRQDIEDGILRLNFSKGIEDDVTLRVVFRIIRFMQQYGFKPDCTVQDLLTEFFSDTERFKLAKEQSGLRGFVINVYEHAESIDSATAFLNSIGALQFIKDKGVDIEEIIRNVNIRSRLRQRGINVTDALSKDLSGFSGSLDIIDLLVERGLMEVVKKREVKVSGAVAAIAPDTAGYGAAPGYAATAAGPQQAAALAQQAPGYAAQGQQAPETATPQAPGYAAQGQAAGYGAQAGAPAAAVSTRVAITGRDLLEAEVDAIDILLGRIERFGSVESPHFEVDRKARYLTARYLTKDYSPGQAVEDFATLDPEMDKMIIAELEKRGIADEHVKRHVMKTVEKFRTFTPAHLGHVLREDLSFVEYYTLNFRAIEIA